MKKILIIDDEEGMRKSLTILISRDGYIVDTLSGSSGSDELIRESKPDIVLTDHNLGAGEEEGYTLAMRLKKQGVKVVLMSADDRIGSKALKNNLAFCQKPFVIKTLLNTLAEASHV